MTHRIKSYVDEAYTVANQEMLVQCFPVNGRVYAFYPVVVLPQHPVIFLEIQSVMQISLLLLLLLLLLLMMCI